MRFWILLTAMLALSACGDYDALKKNEDTSFRLLHYNIKELSTAKLVEPSDLDKQQVQAAAKVISDIMPDILSINELQFDIKNTPRKGFPGGGKNMTRLLEKTTLNSTSWDYHFAQANTGNLAKKQPDGNYPLDASTSESRAGADQDNFGVFPGQYSTGLATAWRMEEAKTYARIAWRSWDQDFDFAAYAQADGKPINEDLELFDKNFNDVVVNVNGARVHLILLHTVPAYNFGNPKGLNHERNSAQLAFLRWYILGACDATSEDAVKRCEDPDGPRPLPRSARFIVVGDLNIGLESSDPGAEELQKIYASRFVSKNIPSTTQTGFTNAAGEDSSRTTYIGGGSDLGSMQLHLDYIIVSTGIAIDKLDIVMPEADYKEHDCFAEESNASALLTQINSGFSDDHVVQVSQRYGETKPYCVISTTRAFAEFRKGSDHLPLLLEGRIF